MTRSNPTPFSEARTIMMNRRLRQRVQSGAFIAFFVFLAGAIPAAAQRLAPHDPAEPATGKPQPRILARPAGRLTRASVDEKSLRVLIGKLVGCGTRLTLSSGTAAKRGVGCGQDAVEERLHEIAQDYG